MGHLRSINLPSADIHHNRMGRHQRRRRFGPRRHRRQGLQGARWSGQWTIAVQPDRPNLEGSALNDEDAPLGQLAHRVVEILAIAPTVLDLPALAGSQQGFVLGLTTPVITLAPAVEDVPG